MVLTDSDQMTVYVGFYERMDTIMIYTDHTQYILTIHLSLSVYIYTDHTHIYDHTYICLFKLYTDHTPLTKKRTVHVQLTCVMIRSAPVPSSSLNLMSGLSFRTRSLNLGSDLLMGFSAIPLAPSVFSDTFGTCCLNTNGVNFRGRRLRPEPRPGPHDSVSELSRRQRHSTGNTV